MIKKLKDIYQKKKSNFECKFSVLEFLRKVFLLTINKSILHLNLSPDNLFLIIFVG